MNVRLKRARELAGYAVQLTRDEGLPTMLKPVSYTHLTLPTNREV